MIDEDVEVSGADQYLDQIGVEGDLDYGRAKEVKPEGDFTVLIEYDGQEIGTMKGENYETPEGLFLNGKAPWIQSDDWSLTTQNDTEYALTVEGGNLMLYRDQDPEILESGMDAEDGIIAYLDGEASEEPERERGAVTLVPGGKTGLSIRESLI